MQKNVQLTPFAKPKMIPQKLDNFHEPFGHNKSGGLWVSATVDHAVCLPKNMSYVFSHHFLIKHQKNKYNVNANFSQSPAGG